MPSTTKRASYQRKVRNVLQVAETLTKESTVTSDHNFGSPIFFPTLPEI